VVADELVVVPAERRGVLCVDALEVGDDTVDPECRSDQLVPPEVDAVDDRVCVAVRMVGEEVVSVRPEDIVVEVDLAQDRSGAERLDVDRGTT